MFLTETGELVFHSLKPESKENLSTVEIEFQDLIRDPERIPPEIQEEMETFKQLINYKERIKEESPVPVSDFKKGGNSQ